jgi:uncharacterized membrane protein
VQESAAFTTASSSPDRRSQPTASQRSAGARGGRHRERPLANPESPESEAPAESVAAAGAERPGSTGGAGTVGRVAAAVGGAALLAWAVKAPRRGHRGRGWIELGAALAGAPLVYRGLTGQWPVSRALAERAAAPLTIEAGETIARSADDLYAFWRRLENLPRFMKGLDTVTEDGGRSHWVGHTPLGLKREWDAEIAEDQPGRLLSWRSLPGAQVRIAGWVLFADATGQRGTVVRVTMEVSPPGDGLRRAVGKALTLGIAQQVREELRRFKCLMEAGEVPTTEGQPAGQRSAIGRRDLPGRI